MNKARIFGIILIIIGFTLSYSIENDGIDFIFGLFVGSGFLLTLTGSFSSKRKT